MRAEREEADRERKGLKQKGRERREREQESWPGSQSFYIQHTPIARSLGGA